MKTKQNEIGLSLMGKLFIPFILLFLSLHCISQTGSPGNLIKNPTFTPNASWNGFTLTDAFNLGMVDNWTALNTPDLDFDKTTPPTSTFLWAYRQGEYEAVTSDSFEIKDGCYLVGLKLKHKLPGNVIIDYDDIRLLGSTDMPTMNPAQGYGILKLNKTISTNWVTYGTSFTYIKGKTLPANFTSGKIMVFPYSTDIACNTSVAGILIDDVELLPNFGFMKRTQEAPCGTQSVISLVDTQMPTFSFHNPTYTVYDLQGKLISNSLMFSYTVNSATKLVVVRHLEVNGVTLPTAGSLLCDGTDTVELVPGPQPLSMILVQQSSTCGNDLILKSWMTNQMIYSWTLPSGTKQNYSYNNVATFKNPVTGWYKCQIFSSTGCGYIDSIYITITNSNPILKFAQNDTIIPCGETVVLDGDIYRMGNGGGYNFEWRKAGRATVIGYSAQVTTQVFGNTTYIVEATSTTAPFCKFIDTVVVTTTNAVAPIITILTKCISQGDELQLEARIKTDSTQYQLILPNGNVMYAFYPNYRFIIPAAMAGWYKLIALPPGGNCSIMDSVLIQYDNTGCGNYTANSPFENRTLTRDIFYNFYYELTIADTSYFKDNNYIVIGVPIKVPAGLSFTISNCNIIMKKCGKIVVDRYGELKIINTKIGGCRWQGIEVWGDENACAPDPVQGRLTLINSGISNADIGVLLGARPSGHPGTNVSYGGGILICSNDTFTQNAYDIVFNEYIRDFLSEYLASNGDPGCPARYSGKDLYISSITNTYFGPRWPEECCYDYVKSKLQDYNIYYNVSIADFHIVDFGDVRISPSYSMLGISPLCNRQIRNRFNSNGYFQTLAFGINCNGMIPINNSYK